MWPPLVLDDIVFRKKPQLADFETAELAGRGAASRTGRPAMSDKIKSQHVGRKALLYVRQSSTYQVNHNLESQRLQYAMHQRLQILGWREIEVIDEDLGCSAQEQ